MKKGEYLFDRLGEVNEKFVDEAESYSKSSGSFAEKTADTEMTSDKIKKIECVIRKSKKRIRIIPAAIAACVAVSLLSMPWILKKNVHNSPLSDDPEVTGDESETISTDISNDTEQGSDLPLLEDDGNIYPSCIYEMNSETNEYELVYRYDPSYTDKQIVINRDTDFKNPEINSWSVDTALIEIGDYFNEKYNLEELDLGINAFNKGGYDLYLTTDRNIQAHLDEKYADWTYFPNALSDAEYQSEESRMVQSAFVVMDYEGHIISVEGQLGTKEYNLGFNYAYEGKRHIGTSITPVTVYGYALENDLLSWSSYFYDQSLPSGEYPLSDQWPLNFDGTPSGGYYPAYYFFKQDKNTLPAQIIYNNGNDLKNEVYDFATKKLHLDLEPEWDADYDSLCMGATNTGPTVINLANAYMPYGNGGKYYKATIINKLVDSRTGEVLIDNASREGEQAVSEETSYIMNKMLREVTENGTASAAKLLNTPVAAKTGTTENWRDITFVGMTPDYVSAMWIGYDQGENQDAIRCSSSARIWKDVFGNYADEHASDKKFPECDTVLCERYCSISGKRASEGCPGEEMGYFKASDPVCDCS